MWNRDFRHPQAFVWVLEEEMRMGIGASPGVAKD
jgi:hypothetical protein